MSDLVPLIVHPAHSTAVDKENSYPHQNNNADGGASSDWGRVCGLDGFWRLVFSVVVDAGWRCGDVLRLEGVGGLQWDLGVGDVYEGLGLL